MTRSTVNILKASEILGYSNKRGLQSVIYRNPEWFPKSLLRARNREELFFYRDEIEALLTNEDFLAARRNGDRVHHKRQPETRNQGSRVIVKKPATKPNIFRISKDLVFNRDTRIFELRQTTG